MENPIDDLTFIQQIAPCKYGNVYLTSKQGSSIQYCTKIIDRNVIDKNKSEKKFLEKEISILKDLNHPNIIKLIETKETEDKYYIVTEYYNGGNLEQYVNVYKHLYHRNLPEKIVQYIMRQIIEAFKYIHNKNILHRKISLQNIMIKYHDEKDKQNADILKAQIKICNFNYATYVSKGNKERKHIGIPLYMDPISLIHPDDYEYNHKYDIWSLGIVCYILLTGESPFCSNNQFQELLDRVHIGTYNVPKIWSKELVSFLNCMLQYEPDKRLGIEHLYNHEFLRKNINEFNKINLDNLKDIEISDSNIVMKIKNNEPQMAYFGNGIEN